MVKNLDFGSMLRVHKKWYRDKRSYILWDSKSAQQIREFCDEIKPSLLSHIPSCCTQYSQEKSS